MSREVRAPGIDLPAGSEMSFLAGGGQNSALMRSIDWSSTPLGPIRTWPQSLRTALSICMSSRFPITLYWGPEFLMLYNDDLLPMVGANKHPWALGRPAFEVLPEIRAIIEPLLRKVIDTGEAIWSEDLMLPLQRGEAPEEGYFTFTYSPVRDESGGVGGVFCAVLETTDKVIEGRRLRLLNALAAAATQAKTPAQACALAAAQLAHAPSDVPFALIYLVDEGEGVARRVGASNIDTDSPLAPATMAPGEHAPWPFPSSRTPGQKRFVPLEQGPGGARGAMVLPIERAGGGAPLGFIVAGLSALLRSSESYERFHLLLSASISQAVSNAAAYEAERKRAESLAELDRAKTTFFSNVSHEFRTPLTLMLAPIQDMLAAPTGDPVDRSSVELLNRNALRLLKLVNTLLEFSRIEAGRIEAIYEPVDLSALTADLASMFRAAIERAGLALIVDCAPLHEPVYVDREMWEKIVLNLLSNAFKFTFEGSIAVRLRQDGPQVVLEVADTGIGIAESDRPRLFERFHRIEGARSRSHEGSGIGLALIQELVRLHGGEVRVRSRPGVGTAFEVRIPRGSAHLAQERVHAARTLPSTAVRADVYVEEALRWGATSGEHPVPPEAVLGAVASRDRILFADDNADMREYVARLLRERWDVETVGDGLAALEAIRRDPPALVLCDVMMPGLDGFALVEVLRADEVLRTMPIILLSARAGEEESSRGLRSGANDYIAKPFSARELLVRVASTLATARAAEALRQQERLQRENLYRLFMQSPFPIAVLRGPDHIIELANPQILRAWGKDEQILGRPLELALPEVRDQPFIGYLNEVYRSGVPHEGRAELARMPTGPDGRLEDVYFNFVYAPLRDPTGMIEGILLAAFDVTAVVQARRVSEQARQGAEAAERAQRAIVEFQERFVAVLGHDLRNPLAALSMATALLRRRLAPAADEAVGRTLGRIETSTRRMTRMVEQILDLTRSRIGGGIVVNPAPVDLGTVLTGAVDELRTAHPHRAIVLRCPAISGSWDRDRMEQVFSNLIGNAIHHGDAKQPVTVEARDEGHQVCIEVHNHGAPIPGSLLPVLFEPFRRGERDGQSANTAGLGLGLYISQQIVLAHGGDIQVHSHPDDGTRFRVTLSRTVLLTPSRLS
jgi:signal transduction histidine kinase/FixJ family two-component response regulator